MLVNGVVLAVNYALIALGITLIFSIMNILNFAHGQMFMIGGFVVYYLYGIFKVNYFVSLVAVVIVLGFVVYEVSKIVAYSKYRHVGTAHDRR